jgi:alpha-tubulin suppressor-like RCC1 family protein
MPTDVTFSAISAGHRHSLALDQNGNAWAWGANAYGQVGDNSTGSIRAAPTAVTMPTGFTFTAVSAGYFHSVALDQHGNAWAWGRNDHGQIGDTTYANERTVPTPVAMPTGVTFSAISADGSYSLALDQNGNAWAWGDNGWGQVGDGTTGSIRAAPTRVIMPPDVTFVGVGTGQGHALALDQDGHGWAWGLNMEGQVGDGTYNNRYLVPAAVEMP